MRLPSIVITTIASGLLLSSCWGGPEIEGKYTSNEGATAEFLSNGTLVFTSGGKQGVWTWERVDDGRISMSPNSGMLGTKAAVCSYTMLNNGMELSGCHLAMTLTRI